MEEVKTMTNEEITDVTAVTEEIVETATEEPMPVQAEGAVQEAVQPIGETAKPKNTAFNIAIGVLVVSVIALVALAGVYAFTLIRANGIVNDAVELAEGEDYVAALAALDELSDSTQYEKALKKLQVVLDAQLEEAADDEDYVKIDELLGNAQWHPDYEELSEENNEALSESIVALMDEGDYAAASKMLKKVSEHPDFKELQEMITAESWIWTCINNLKPVMKNPRSLQINSVEIYEPYDDGAEYPVIILCESGQNGFGGYATSYTVYDDEDLSLFGSTSSLSDPDDFNEMLIVAIIEGYRKTTEIRYEYDLNRINKLLSDGVSVKTDLQTYELGSYKNT